MASSESEEKKEAKLWGGRFEEGVADAVEHFTESISYDWQLYKYDIMGSKAHATMLAAQGLITAGDRDIIIEGLDQIERLIQEGKFEWRKDREDVHMNIEAALIERFGEPAKKLHTARSRNDQIVTDLRLWCRDSIDKILIRIKQLQMALVMLASKYVDLIVPGYTHLQRAQPILLPHLLLSYVEQGVPFRTSHEIVGRSVALCTSKNCQLGELKLDDLKAVRPVFESEVYEYLGVENAVNKFISYGSTGSEQVKEQLQDWRIQLGMSS